MAIKYAMRIGNLKGIVRHQCYSQQIISQYVDDMSFTVRMEESNVDKFLGILHKFRTTFGLEINQHKFVAYWCGRGLRLGWVEKYHWKWAANGNLSKLLGMPFGLDLELRHVDQIWRNRVKSKLKYWSSTTLLLAWQILIVNKVFMSSCWYFITVWASSKRILGKIKVLLCNYFSYGFDNTTKARVSQDNSTMPKKVGGLSFIFPEDAMRALMRKWIIQALFMASQTCKLY